MSTWSLCFVVANLARLLACYLSELGWIPSVSYTELEFLLPLRSKCVCPFTLSVFVICTTISTPQFLVRSLRHSISAPCPLDRGRLPVTLAKSFCSNQFLIFLRQVVDQLEPTRAIFCDDDMQSSFRFRLTTFFGQPVSTSPIAVFGSCPICLTGCVLGLLIHCLLIYLPCVPGISLGLTSS